MRSVHVLGLVIIAALILLTSALPLAWNDATSAETVRRGAVTGGDPYGEPLSASAMAFGILPVDVTLILLAAAFLVALAYALPDDGATLLVILSPAFLTTFTVAGPAALAAPLIALVAALAMRDRTEAVLGLPLVFLVDTGAGLAATLVLIVIAIGRQRPFVALVTSAVALALATVATAILPGRGSGLMAVRDTGYAFGPAGISVLVLVVLALVGIALTYRERKDPAVLGILIAIPALAMLEHATILLTVVLAWFAAKTWNTLVKRQWNFHELRSTTLILVLCTLAFGSIVTVRETLTVDTGRLELQRFVEDAIPADAPVLAPRDVASGLRLGGTYVEAADATAPDDILAEAEERGSRFIVTRGEITAAREVTYSDFVEDGYRIYATR
jgi:hypothetical protein